MEDRWGLICYIERIQQKLKKHTTEFLHYEKQEKDTEFSPYLTTL